MDILDTAKTIATFIAAIIPALAILGKFKEFFDVYEKFPWSKRNRIKKALENPYLSANSKASYGRTLTRLEFRSVYRFSPPINYINKMIKVEQLSQNNIDMEDFAIAAQYLDFKNGEIRIKDRIKWYSLNRDYKFWLSFLLLAISFIAFGYYFLIFTSQHFLNAFHFNKPILFDDFVLTACIPIYLIAAFITRDEARGLTSLIKIIDFARVNPSLITLVSSRVP